MYILGFFYFLKDDYLVFWIGVNFWIDGEGFKWSNGVLFVFYNWFLGNLIKKKNYIEK